MNENNEKHRKTSLRDVASEAGVSPSTVSRILSNAPNFTFSDEVRERVLETVQRLEYKPKLSLRNALKQFEGTVDETGRRRTNNIALVLRKEQLGETVVLLDPGSMFRDLAFFAEERGFNLLITIISNTSLLPQPILEEKIDAAIIAADVPVELIRMIKSHVPVVTIHLDMPDLFVSGAVVDEVNAYRQALEYLLEIGHKRIAMCIRSIEPGETGDKRYRSIIKMAAHLGVKIVDEWTRPFYCEVNSTKVEIQHLVEKYLEKDEKPSAIVAFDFEAVWIYHALRARGIDIPDDISLVLVGNMACGKFCEFPLTSAASPLKEISRWVIDEAVKLVELPDHPVSFVTFSTVLKKQSSTAPYKP